LGDLKIQKTVAEIVETFFWHGGHRGHGKHGRMSGGFTLLSHLYWTFGNF